MKNHSSSFHQVYCLSNSDSSAFDQTIINDIAVFELHSTPVLQKMPVAACTYLNGSHDALIKILWTL
jgi:hypothetical protein